MALNVYACMCMMYMYMFSVFHSVEDTTVLGAIWMENISYVNIENLEKQKNNALS